MLLARDDRTAQPLSGGVVRILLKLHILVKFGKGTQHSCSVHNTQIQPKTMHPK